MGAASVDDADEADAPFVSEAADAAPSAPSSDATLGASVRRRRRFSRVQPADALDDEHLRSR